MAPTVAPVPSGESPDGTGESPVLPANHFSNTLLPPANVWQPFWLRGIGFDDRTLIGSTRRDGLLNQVEHSLDGNRGPKFVL